MIIFAKLLVFLTTCITCAGFFSIFSLSRYSAKYYALGVMLISAGLITGINLILRKKKLTTADRFLFLVSPVSFALSASFASVFINGALFKILFTVVAALVIYLYLENLFLYFYIPSKYHIYALENLSSYINLLAVFFFCLSFLGIKILYGLNMYWSIGLVFLSVMIFILLIYQTLWINKINLKEAKTYVISAVLVLAEVYFIIYLLPGSFYSSALIVTLFYYTIIGLMKYKLLNKLERTIALKYIGISFILFCLLLLTTKWA